MNAARTEADSVGDEAWIAYLDVIAGDAAIEHSMADAQVDGLIDFEIDGPPGIIVLYRFIERAGVLKPTRIKQFYETTGFTGTFDAGSYVVELTYTTGVIEFPFVFTGGEPLRLRLTVPSLVYDRTRYALLAQGEAILGGDPLAWDALPRRRLEMPTYLIARRPVSLPGIPRIPQQSVGSTRARKSHEACAKRSRE